MLLVCVPASPVVGMEDRMDTERALYVKFIEGMRENARTDVATERELKIGCFRGLMTDLPNIVHKFNAKRQPYWFVRWFRWAVGENVKEMQSIISTPLDGEFPFWCTRFFTTLRSFIGVLIFARNVSVEFIELDDPDNVTVEVTYGLVV